MSDVFVEQRVEQRDMASLFNENTNQALFETNKQANKGGKKIHDGDDWCIVPSVIDVSLGRHDGLGL